MPGSSSELAPVASSSSSPLHPYTRALVRSIPRIDREIALEPIAGRGALAARSAGRAAAMSGAARMDARCASPADGRRLIAAAGDRASVACHRRGGRPHAALRERRAGSRSISRCAARAGCAAAGRQPPVVRAVDGVSFDRRPRARRSAWWASRAAASRRWRAASLGCWCPPTGQRPLRRRASSPGSTASRCARRAATCRWCSRTRRRRSTRACRCGARSRAAAPAHRLSPAERRERVTRDAEPRWGWAPTLAERYPHELSGGQRQRVNIARAIA